MNSIFIDEHDEPSFKKCMDIFEMSKKLIEKGVPLDPKIGEIMGQMFTCFGLIEQERQYGFRLPEETEEEKRQK